MSVDYAVSPFDQANRLSRADPDENGVKRDQWGRYVVPHPKTGKEMSWTRATTFAKSISDTYTLDMWGRRMVMRGLVLRKDILAKVAATPDEEKQKLDGLAKEASDAAAARAGSNLGTALHAFTEQVDHGMDVVIPEPWDADIAAYRSTMRSAGLTVLPDYIERIILNTQFTVGGTFDRVVEVTRDATISFGSGETAVLEPGQRLIFDLKTGRTLQYGWGEIAVQLALYAHADVIWNKDTGKHEPMPSVRQDVGLVLHLPAGSAQATLYGVDLTEGHRAAQLCQQVRQWRTNRTLAAPLLVADPRPVSAPPVLNARIAAPSPVIREPSWLERIENATSRGELEEIWRAADAQRQWSVALTDASKRRLEQLAS